MIVRFAQSAIPDERRRWRTANCDARAVAGHLSLSVDSHFQNADGVNTRMP